MQQWTLQADPQMFEKLAIVIEWYLTLEKLTKAKPGWQPVTKPRTQVPEAKAPTPSPVVCFNLYTTLFVVPCLSFCYRIGESLYLAAHVHLFYL